MSYIAQLKIEWRNKVSVYQIRMKLFSLKTIPYDEVQSSLAAFIDQGLVKNNLKEVHYQNRYKWYIFDGLYPVEVSRIYERENIYTFTIRTIDKELALFFSNVLTQFSNNTFKALTSEIKIIAKKHITKIFSITPCVLKDQAGYWKDHMTLEEFENRIKVNLIKKKNEFDETKMDEDFQLFTAIVLKNKVPIGIKYKDIKLLGDKIEATISDHPLAQELAYMALGCGILENNGRGYGFMNFRYL